MNTIRIDTMLVDLQFMADVTAVLSAISDGTNNSWVVTCGWRDGAVEKAGHDAWLADPSKPKFTDPSNSAHVGANFPDGKARAVDVTLVVDGDGVRRVA